jgi:hypothetical protein
MPNDVRQRPNRDCVRAESFCADEVQATTRQMKIQSQRATCAREIERQNDKKTKGQKQKGELRNVFEFSPKESSAEVF